MPDRDEHYVRHMFLMSRKLIDKANSISLDQFLANEDQQFVFVHLLQILGESARRVSARFQEEHDHIPWREIVGMRHKIVHDYLEVDLQIVWKTVREELPKLNAQLEALFDSFSSEP